jgi:hypothetical protein
MNAARIAAARRRVMPGAVSTCRRSIGILLIIAATLLTAAVSPAAANPPTLASAGASGGIVTAQWALPPSVVAEFVEVAHYPDVNAYGYFVCSGALRGADFCRSNPAVARFGILNPDQTSLTSGDVKPPLSAGTYYVHIAGHDSVHTGCPQIEFSATFGITIDANGNAATTQPVAPGTGECTLIRRPGGIIERGGGGGGGGALPGDRTAPTAQLRVARRQDVDKLTVRARMSEPGTLTAGALVRVGGLSGRTYAFRIASRKVTGGVLAKLRPKLAKRHKRVVKRALRRKRLRAQITVTATDRAGNSRTLRRTVTLKP